MLLNIEHVQGSAFADHLVGDGGYNRLLGEGGDDFLDGGNDRPDVLDGGEGADTVSYAGSWAAVVVSLTSNAGQGGDADGDTLISIEKVIGSDHNDCLYGNADANTLAGGAGADYLDGRDGVDTADYSASSDGIDARLIGTSHGGDAEGDRLVAVENIRGSAFADRLTGNAGANVFMGGGGSDTVSYAEGTVGVTVDLATGIAVGGNAQGDVLTSIENLDGTQGGDNPHRGCCGKCAARARR